MTAGSDTLAVPGAAAAQRVLEELGGRDSFELAFLSGSVAAGLGHANSDVDAHVVPTPGFRLERRTHDVEGRRVQLELVERERVERTAELLERYVVTPANRDQAELDDLQLWHLIRLVTGHVLWASDEYRELLDRIRPDVARQVVAANFAHRVARACENGDGMLKHGQHLSACHAAACAVAAACEVGRALEGDLYAVDRFLVARLARSTVFCPLLPRLWSLLYRFPEAGSETDVLADAVRERLLVANGLAAHALVHGWETPLSRPPRLARAGGEGPERAVEFGLLRFADTFGLAGPRSSLRIGAAVAAVWATLDGEAPPASAVTTTVATLVEAGAATWEARGAVTAAAGEEVR